MSDKIIIFDFDGTIADTRNALVEIANSLAGEFDYQPVTKEQILELSHLNSREIIEQMALAPYKIPFLLRRVRKELNNKIATLKPFQGMENSLQKLKEKKYQLGIITSNIEENVLAFLQNNRLDSLFDFVYSGTSLFGKDKAIARLIRKNNLTSEQIIYVGDETRDIEAAKKSKIKIIAVTWGFNSPKILAQYQPNGLIHHPEEIEPLILKLGQN